MTLLDEEKNKVKINEKALSSMTKQIVLAERDNIKKNTSANPKKEMIKLISEIIEKTVNNTEEENAD